MSASQRIFNIGLDVGQRVDHSAVCLVEVLEAKVIVRALIKYPLGTGFPQVVDTVAEMYHSVTQKGSVYYFAVDATGMGIHPAKMLQEKLPEASIEAFIFNNKNKKELVGKVKMLHAYGRLKFAFQKGDEAYNRTLQQLIVEMKSVQAKVIRESDTAPEIEVFKTGAHDDLFTALALAVKDVDFSMMANWADKIAFVEDKTWLKTPLDQMTNDAPIVLF